MLSIDALPAFAVLNLESFASGDAIRKKATAIAMRERLSGDGLGLGEAARAAAERLADPVIWLRESLRWVLLPTGTLDRGSVDCLQLLTQSSDPLRALVESESATEARAHNQAVLAVLNALRTDTPGGAEAALGAVRRAAAGVHRSTSAGSHGLGAASSSSVIVATPLWNLAIRAAERRADPRLTEAVLADARVGYINGLAGTLLTSWRERIASMGGLQLRSLLARCGEIDHEVGDGDLRGFLLGPFLERLEHAIGTYPQRLGSAASKHALEVISKEIREHLDVDMNALVSAAEQGGAQALRVRDLYAELLRSSAIRGCNEFAMFRAAEPLLTRAKAVAASVALRERLDDDLKQAAESAVYGVCIYCRTAEADGQPAQVSMFQVTERYFGGKSYRSGELPVPRCKVCEAKHGTHGSVKVWTVVSLLVLGGLIGLGSNGGGGLFGGACLGGIAGALIAGVIGFVMKLSSRGSPEDFPPIRDMLAQGWRFGARPGKFD